MKNRTRALEDLAASVQRFAETIENLPCELLRTSMNGWSPGDVIAHLIGWNRLTITGCEEILRGDSPSYLEDVDEDFRHVNARFVRRHATKNREELLAELRASAADAAAYVRSLTPASWATSVRFRRFTISVADCIDGLQQDYETHRRRILDWSAKR